MEMSIKKAMRIKLNAVSEDEATGEFQAIIKFRDIDGKYRSMSMPLSDLEDLKSLKRSLIDRGCYFAKRETKVDSALRRLARSTERARRWKFAARTGWYDGHRQFVRPDGIIGKFRGNMPIKSPRTAGRSHHSALQIRGSHKKWVRSVAMPARHSSRMVLGICMSLAAPLLDFAALNSFAILVHGPGKAGKSTMLLVAGSVSGFGSERDLPNFRSTDAAFGEIPVSFNDMLMPMNELGLLKGASKERSDRIRDLTYGFAEGRGTTYSHLASNGMSVGERMWRSILLATGEETIEQISEAAGHTRASGEAIRLFDLCATRKGEQDIFDLAPKTVAERDRKPWVGQQCAALRNACSANHGVAFNHFIRRVIKERKAIKKDLRELTRQFANDVTDEKDGQHVRHLAMCFGHIAAAGILGIRFGTLPWTEEFVIKCVKRCYRDARRSLRTESDLLAEGLRILEDGVHSTKVLKVSRKKKHSNSAWKRADGYREKTDLGTKVTIRGEAFKGWFPDQRQPAVVLRWLRSKNALCSNRSPSGSSGPAITWAESQPLWPDGLRPRSIALKVHPGLLGDSKK